VRAVLVDRRPARRLQRRILGRLTKESSSVAEVAGSAAAELYGATALSPLRYTDAVAAEVQAQRRGPAN
jgi:hypothetical protein